MPSKRDIPALDDIGNPIEIESDFGSVSAFAYALVNCEQRLTSPGPNGNKIMNENN